MWNILRNIIFLEKIASRFSQTAWIFTQLHSNARYDSYLSGLTKFFPHILVFAKYFTFLDAGVDWILVTSGLGSVETLTKCVISFGFFTWNRQFLDRSGVPWVPKAHWGWFEFQFFQINCWFHGNVLVRDFVCEKKAILPHFQIAFQHNTSLYLWIVQDFIKVSPRFVPIVKSQKNLKNIKHIHFAN